MESSINVRWIIPFKQFGMVRVKNARESHTGTRYNHDSYNQLLCIVIYSF